MLKCHSLKNTLSHKIRSWHWQVRWREKLRLIEGKRGKGREKKKEISGDLGEKSTYQFSYLFGQYSELVALIYAARKKVLKILNHFPQKIQCFRMFSSRRSCTKKKLFNRIEYSMFSLLVPPMVLTGGARKI